MRPRTRFRPTKLLLGLVVGVLSLFAVGTNVQAGWVLVIAALLGGIALIGAVLPVRALSGVSVARTTPPSGRAGEEMTVELSVSLERGGARGPVLVRDEAFGGGAAVVPLLRRGTTRTFTASRVPPRRGVYTSAPCEVISGAPFGVVVARRKLEVPSLTVVHPRTFGLSLTPLLGEAARPNRSPDGDITSVREYRPGDPLRRVHWRATARRGALVVREFEDRDRADVTVVAVTGPDPDAADAVASIACSVGLAAIADRRALALLSGDRGSPSTLTTDAVDRVLDWGARLAPDPTPASALIASAPSRAVVLVTAVPDDVGTASLAALAASGADVLLVAVDHDVDTLGIDAMTVNSDADLAACFAAS